MRKDKYSAELKLAVLQEYKRGEIGYKALAKKYSVSRDLVRDWVTNTKLKLAMQIASDTPDSEHDINFYKAEVAYWKAYAKLLEEQKLGKEVSEKN